MKSVTSYRQHDVTRQKLLYLQLNKERMTLDQRKPMMLLGFDEVFHSRTSNLSREEKEELQITLTRCLWHIPQNRTHLRPWLIAVRTLNCSPVTPMALHLMKRLHKPNRHSSSVSVGERVLSCLYSSRWRSQCYRNEENRHGAGKRWRPYSKRSERFETCYEIHTVELAGKCFRVRY